MQLSRGLQRRGLAELLGYRESGVQRHCLQPRRAHTEVVHGEVDEADALGQRCVRDRVVASGRCRKARIASDRIRVGAARLGGSQVGLGDEEVSVDAAPPALDLHRLVRAHHEVGLEDVAAVRALDANVTGVLDHHGAGAIELPVGGGDHPEPMDSCGGRGEVHGNQGLTGPSFRSFCSVGAMATAR